MCVPIQLLYTTTQPATLSFPVSIPEPANPLFPRHLFYRGVFFCRMSPMPGQNAGRGKGEAGGGDMGRDVAKVLKNSGFVMRHDATCTLYIFSPQTSNIAYLPSRTAQFRTSV